VDTKYKKRRLSVQIAVKSLAKPERSTGPLLHLKLWNCERAASRLKGRTIAFPPKTKLKAGMQ
jgi:hypothetical protein